MPLERNKRDTAVSLDQLKICINNRNEEETSFKKTKKV